MLPSNVVHLCVSSQVKELPTYKDVDFRNNMQKVYVTEEEKEKVMEKLNRDVEVKKHLTLLIFPNRDAQCGQ